MSRHGLRRSYLVSLTILAVLAFVLGVIYLDPGTGSMLVQLIVGGFAAAGVALKLYWRRFTSLFRRTKAELRSAEPDQDR